MPIDIIEITKSAVEISLWLVLPPLLVSMLIGLFVSIFQAVTQIQDQSLQFVPKLIIVFFVLFLMFQFNYTKLETFTLDNFKLISTITQNKVVKPEYSSNVLAPSLDVQ